MLSVSGDAKKLEAAPKRISKMEKPECKEKRPPVLLFCIIGEQTLSAARCHWGLRISNKKSTRELDAVSVVLCLIYRDAPGARIDAPSRCTSPKAKNFGAICKSLQKLGLQWKQRQPLNYSSACGSCDN